MPSITDPRVRFTWNIHYSCNYRCPYCFFDGKWIEYKKRNVYLAPDEWMKYWNKIYERYGRSYILITGGEPFMYPGFVDLIEKLSQVHYPINISTNASGDLPSFVERVDPARVSLSISLQLNFEKIDSFLEKVKFLRSHKFGGCINFVAYPPFIKQVNFINGRFNQIGEKLKIIPFWGKFQGKEYPFSYTPEEKQVIGIGDDWYARVRKKDSLCPAGHNSALIFPDGKVARCGQIGEKHLVGDFFDTNFSLLDSPLVCEADHCPCDESRLFGEESTDSDLDVKGSPTGNVNIDLSGLQELQRKNSDLNDREYNEGKIILESSPKAIFIQAAGPCNSYCVFCSRGPDYKLFNLVEHRKKFEKNLYPFIERAQTLIFTGSGEFLQLPDAQDTLDFFDYRFPHVQKFFSTNGSSLKQWVADKIISGRSNYTIHASLHASNAKLHKTLTRMDNFDAIIGQIKYIIANRKDASKLKVNLIFVATTLNIEDLPEFIKLASELKVDKVVCYYNFIYVQAQKYLSCFFKQDLTNAMFDQAQDLANRLGIALELPFRFGQAQYPDLGPCREAFSQIMFDWDGNVLPCDAAEDCHERLTEERAFMEVWNSPYYQKLRKSLRENYQACSRHCLRANPAGVNDFKSHVIYRGGGKDEDFNILWGDNF